ncbi:hypothetical protein GCM10010218_30520 [Streptomyces mashuensis]|uniref:WD40 repeat domain-containing protein n=1 Tax=Streptomyces mashuensis TaxID=33904 RepID=A0A919EDC1_9ACTN|nr:hypothetical protein [Streptomyces mashuensis]GHF47124.1 hypothetical protein GCM10010218_30520 [Streptomyces mashuensis]
MRPLRPALPAAVLTTLATLALAPAAPAVADDRGTPPAFTIEDPRITESSGLAASRAHPGIYWTHNDSGDGPYVFAVDSRTGRTVAKITLDGVKARDVEAISLGPDGNLYVGDTGDNLDGSWPEVWIYRFPEPKELKDATVEATRFTVRYEDGPRDAESLVVHPRTGRVYIVSKKKSGKGALYEAPATLSASGVNTFKRVADINVWATDAAFSPDGTRLVVRGYFEARAYRWRDGRPTEITTRPVVPLQRQGESVTFTPDGRTLMYGSEGARSSVVPVALEGELLPDSVAKQDSKEGGGSGGAAGASGESGDDGDGNRTFVLGAGTFLLATAVVLGLKRLLRRSKDPS